jgi:hypothetical protein
LQVRRVTDDMELRRDPVAAVHVARDAGDIQRLAAIVALDEADCLGNELARIRRRPTRSDA